MVFILLLMAFALVSCGNRGGNTTVSSRPASTSGLPLVTSRAVAEVPTKVEIPFWAGDGVYGDPLIKINLSQQKAFFYKSGTLVGVSPISTGKQGYNTSPGNYRVLEKSPNHRSSLYGVYKDEVTKEIVKADVDTKRDKIPQGCYYEGAPMFNFLRFNGGVGMHTGYLPGYSASHGCVRMPDTMARKFYQNAPLGTPVIVI
ncbi:MAG: L,D-transpeptidase family protein [Verrucomicrobiales bacterium]|nr:L,D-transpeptidase family protein [Verrucomicrobiales bacterium]